MVAGGGPTEEADQGRPRSRAVLVRVLGPGEDARQAALEAADDGAQALAVVGGDGSVAAVAAVAGVAVERGLPLAVMPTGTLNHFARDLGLDLARPLHALDAFASGHHERRVDVGQINGRPFINNVSLGVYAEMLGDPEYRGRQAACSANETPGRPLRPGAPTGAPYHATRRGFTRERRRRGRLEQPYEFSRWDRLGHRHRLDTGTLQGSVLDAGTLDELERLLAGTLLGAMEFRPAISHWTSQRLETGVPGEVVRAGIDGEPIVLEASLRFSVDPAALRVLVPEGSPARRQAPPLEAGWHAA